MKIFAIDFDGTLVTDAFPEIGEPNTLLLNCLKALKHTNPEVRYILWTCRNKGHLEKAVAWCKEHELELDAVNENLPEIQARYGGDTRKVMADFYIDDKSWTPEGWLCALSEQVFRSAASC